MAPAPRSVPRALLAVSASAWILTGCTSFAAATDSAGSTGSAASAPTASSSTAAVPVTETTAASTAAPSTAAPSTAGSVTDDPVDVATDAPRSSSPQHEVTVSYAEWDTAASAVVVGAYLDDAVEDGGRCTLTLTRNGTKVTVHAEGAADASSTDCLGLQVAGSKLSSGAWQGVVRYESASLTAVSDSFSVDVP